MIVPIFSISLLIIGCLSAPTPPSDGPVKMGLSLDGIKPGLVEIANQQIASLSESAAQKAAEINNLVETASKTLQPVYQTVSDTFNSGLNTVSDTASKTLQPVYQTVSETFNTGLNTVSDTASSGFKAVSQTVTDGLTAISGRVSDGITAVSSKVRDGIVSAKNVVEDQYEAAASALNSQVEIVGSIATQAQTAATGISGNIASAVNEKTAAVGRLISIPASGPGLFEDRPRKLENAVLEQEDFLSSKLSIKDNLQGFVGGIFQPQPIVDNITEEEKYGNDGDQFASIGRALVGTTEGLTKFFSNAINIPFDAIKTITRSASDKLNNFGARLIGLK